jgi:hypothetical protein
VDHKQTEGPNKRAQKSELGGACMYMRIFISSDKRNERTKDIFGLLSNLSYFV